MPKEAKGLSKALNSFSLERGMNQLDEEGAA